MKPVGNVNAAAANASGSHRGRPVKQLTRPAQNGRDMSRYCHVTVTVTSRDLHPTYIPTGLCTTSRQSLLKVFWFRIPIHRYSP